MYWDIIWKNILYSCGEKHVPISCLWFLGVFPKSQFSIFTYQKSSRIFMESLYRPLSEVGEIEELFPISIKYTEIYYLWPLLDTK